MKKEKTGWLLLFTGLFLITAGFVLGNAVTRALNNTGGTVSMEKVIAEVKPAWKGGETLTADMIKKIKKEYGNNNVSYTMNTITQQQTWDWSGKSFYAVVGGVDNTYSMFHGFEFLSGCFFPPVRKADASKTAIISEEFAWKLFRTLDATGMQLSVYGETFRIVGVFKNQKDIVQQLVQPGMPDIILPAETMLSLDEQAYIDSLELAVDDSIIFGGNTEQALSALRLAGADTTRFSVTDFVTGKKSIGQRPLLLIFTASLASVLLWSVHAFGIIAGMVREIRVVRISGLPKNFRSVLFNQGLKLILPFTTIAVIALLWRQNNFPFYFPAQYIPGETLDGQKYATLLSGSFRQLFLGIDEQASVNIRLLQAANLLSGGFFRVAFLPGFLLCRAGMMTISCGPLEWVLRKAGVLLVACILAVCALCLLSGLPMQNFTEGILILWIFTATGLTLKIERPICTKGVL